jgi:hypothetical protein
MTMITKVRDGGVVLEVGLAELFGAADDDGAERRARDRSHAADDNHLQRRQQEMRSSPSEIDVKVPPTMPAIPASPAPNANTRQKQLYPVAQHRQHVAVVDAGADHHADARAVERQPHADANEDRGGENHEPHRGY